MKTILIFGSGVAGCTAALELARHGLEAILVESATRVGGKNRARE